MSKYNTLNELYILKTINFLNLAFEYKTHNEFKVLMQKLIEFNV